MAGTIARQARAVPIMLALAAVVALGACGQAGTADQARTDEIAGDGAATGDFAGSDGASDGEDRATEDGSEPAAPVPFAAPIEQRIVKSGEITVEVGNIAEALARVRALADDLGGYVGGSQAGTLDDRATLTLRIPASAFDAAIARLHELDGTVLAEVTREEDVTGQVVDLQARIDNLRASEASYRELVARAERIDDILAVQSRLDEVRGQIEQLQAQLDALEGQAALSTLTVTLVPRPAPVEAQSHGWDPGGELDRALASLVAIGQGLVHALIWFVVVWLPVLLVLAGVVLVALRGVLEMRRRVAGVNPRPSGVDDGRG